MQVRKFKCLPYMDTETNLIKHQPMKTDFKVYKRKIHVYQVREGAPVYAWSTNAYPTCRAAVAAAVTRYPSKQFKASFAKD